MILGGGSGKSRDGRGRSVDGEEGGDEGRGGGSGGEEEVEGLRICCAHPRRPLASLAARVPVWGPEPLLIWYAPGAGNAPWLLEFGS